MGNVTNAQYTLTWMWPTVCVRKREIRVDITRWLVYRFSVKVKDCDWTTYGSIAGIFVIQALTIISVSLLYHYH